MEKDTKDTKKSKPKPIIKPVSFSENNEVDTKILKHVKSNNLAFSSYVKDLIINDMRKLEQKNEIAEAINNLSSTILNAISHANFNVISNTKEEIIEEIKEDTSNVVDEEKKNIIGNILNMGK